MKTEELQKNPQLNAYATLLLKWNAKINLIGRSTESEIWSRHIAESANLTQYLPTKTTTLADFGTGAGLPGLIIAVLRPDIQVNLMEADTRKCSFIQEFISTQKVNNVIIYNKRVEEISPFPCDVITSRAFAPLSKLFEYIQPFTKKESLCLFPKGENVITEIKEAEKNWIFDFENIPAIKGHGCLLKVTNLARRDREQA